VIGLALVAAAGAADVYDSERLDVDLGGDIKTFMLATFPYDHVIFLGEDIDPDDLDNPAPEIDPYGQGVSDVRLKLELRAFNKLRFQLHDATTAIAPGAAGGLTNTGVGLTADQAVDLTWELEGGAGLTLRNRVDRLSLGWSGQGGEKLGYDVTVGRQPITFGKALFFTPLDLVNPFNPAVIDQEYKPGVDALRGDLYLGMATQLTLAAAYAGDWDREGMVLAAYGQTTLGLWDLGLFGGSVRGDGVVGLATAGSAGPIGLRGEATYTAPSDEGEDDFVRAAFGGDWRPGARTTISGEVYYQSFGETDPGEYLAAYSSPRFERGEVWLVGVWYAGLSISQEITPTVYGNLAVIGNLVDPSAMVAPVLAWSVAGNVDFAVGGYFGAGKRPYGVTLADLIAEAGLDEDALLAAMPVNSEFGLLPATGFLQLKAYF
jgi:hypothetical protein